MSILFNKHVTRAISNIFLWYIHSKLLYKFNMLQRSWNRTFFFFFSSGFRYIQAATSPKDIVIVVDVSGSMKGLKMTIAKHTINTILDTLGENDFVNVIAVRASFGFHIV